MSRGSRRRLWTPEQGRHFIFEILKPALLRTVLGRPGRSLDARGADRRRIGGNGRREGVRRGTAKGRFQPLRHLGEILIGSLGWRRNRSNRSDRSLGRHRWRGSAFRRANNGSRRLWWLAGTLWPRHHRLRARKPLRNGIGPWFRPSADRLRRESGEGIAAPLRHGRRRASYFIRKRRSCGTRRRFGHLRLSVAKSFGTSAIAVVPAGHIGQ